jgi:putative DNA primase/helicase
MTDTGNGWRFVTRCGHVVLYVHDWGQWLVWDGTRWDPDAMDLVMELAKATAMEIYSEVAEGGRSGGWSGDEVEAGYRWARQSLNTNRLVAMLKAAQSDGAIAITSDQLDTHPYLLPCANGTLNLKTFELQAADPADYMTKSTRIAYDPDATRSATSRVFLETITCGDEDLELYLQKILGYSLTGDVSRRLVFFFHGPGGRNGKSTLLEQVRWVLGDFAAVVPMAALEKQRFSKGIGASSPEIASLKDARFVTASESRTLGIDAEFLSSLRVSGESQ